ncbi:hypothetical protein TI05_14115 [Achromatium sp. WMS3]|nr:hypothetical protein TI05_14115 [Achromatium sp. WMS3]
MGALLDTKGQACQIRFQFYPANTTVDTYKETEPVAEADADPERLLRQHITELAFYLSRTRPDLVGTKISIVLAFNNDQKPAVPVLLAKAINNEGVEGDIVASFCVPLVSLDVSDFIALLHQGGHNPQNLVFSVTAVPWEDKQHQRPLLRSLKRKNNPTIGVQILVPNYPNGTALPTQWHELNSSYCNANDMPFYIPASILEKLKQDEQAFGKRDEPWQERSWFLTGSIERYGNELAVMVQNIFLAEETTANSAELAFSAATWSHLRQRLDASGQILVGWLHSHSMKNLSHISIDQNIQTNTQTIPQPVTPPATSTQNYANGSGLFLSLLDIIAARKGFSAPWMAIGVIDADTCHSGGDEPQHLLALWEWQHGLLIRRSARLVD